MTVTELIQELKTCPEDYKVMSWMSSGLIEEVYGISVVCESTQSVALSGKIDNIPKNVFNLD